jgi:hypothetical protein
MPLVATTIELLQQHLDAIDRDLDKVQPRLMMERRKVQKMLDLRKQKEFFKQLKRAMLPPQ